MGFIKASLGGKVAIISHLVKKYRSWRMFWEWFWMAVIAMVIFLPRLLQVGYEWPQAFHSMCLCFGQILFPWSIFMVILPILLGVNNSFMDTLFGNKKLIFLGKISYCCYILHGLAILYIANRKWYDTYYWVSDIFVNSLTAIVLTVFFGTILHFLV